MKTSEIRDMTIAELRELAMQKNSIGNATQDALCAQRVLHDMTGNCYDSDVHLRAYGSKHFKNPQV
jgi:hypothetical protein